MPGLSEPDSFDALARAGAGGVSRRSLLARAAGLAVAAATTSTVQLTWPTAASADKTRGTCAGTPAKGACDPEYTKEWTPSCPRTIPSGVASTFNGCGPEAGVELSALGHVFGKGDYIPDSPLALADFFAACKGHDCCYGACQSDKAACDQTFLDGMTAACKQEQGGILNTLNPFGSSAYSLCLSMAEVYYSAVAKTSDGQDAWMSAQKTACLCCDDCGDTTSDVNNCGACGHVCPGGDTCCNGECVDTSANGLHCGSCSTQCPDPLRCVGGSCACPDGAITCGGPTDCCAPGYACCVTANGQQCYDPGSYFCCSNGPVSGQGACPTGSNCDDCGCGCDPPEHCCSGAVCSLYLC